VEYLYLRDLSYILVLLLRIFVFWIPPGLGLWQLELRVCNLNDVCYLGNLGDLGFWGCDFPHNRHFRPKFEWVDRCHWTLIAHVRMTDSSEGPRKKRRQAKSFKGCNACKIGKRKCSEDRPTCCQCSMRKIPCEVPSSHWGGS